MTGPNPNSPIQQSLLFAMALSAFEVTLAGADDLTSLDGEIDWASLSNEELDALLAAEEAAFEAEFEIHQWDYEVDLQTGLGYTDNVVDSAFIRDGSLFTQTILDTYLGYIPLNRKNEFLFSAAGDYRRYFETDTINEEIEIFVTSYYKHRWNHRHETGVLGTYFFIDEVFDFTFEDNVIDLDTERIVIHQRILQPFHTVRFGDDWDVSLKPRVVSALFEDSDFDYLEPGGTAEAEWRFSERSRLELQGRFGYRIFDDRNAREPDGTTLDDEPLRYRNQRYRIRYIRTWGENENIRTTTGLTHDRRRDGVQGYSDYNRYRLFQGVRVRWSLWEVEARVDFRHFSYREQIANPDTDNDRLLYRTGVQAELELTREISKQWRAFWRYQFEGQTSPVDTERFQSQRFLIGMGWRLQRE